MKMLSEILGIISDFLTICASGIAVYVFIFKRNEIRTIFEILVGYTYQLSLSELKEKLERLNEYNAREPSDQEQIIIILNELLGQIKGNERIKKHLQVQSLEIEKMLNDKRRLTEPKKRALVSELRERIRHLNVRGIDDFVGGIE